VTTAVAPRDGVQEAEALRLRLYRPDPPPGAVAAYLAAVDGLEQRPIPLPRPEPHRLRRSGLGRRAVRSLVPAVLVGAAVVAGFAALPLATRGLPDAAAVEPPRPTAERYPPVPGVQLGVLAGRSAAARTFDAEGHLVIVSVNCAGSGTITLRLGTDAPVVLTCEAGGPALAMLETSTGVDRVRLDVRPTAGVRWAIAVGAVPAP
jgi:hypothetical protein